MTAAPPLPADVVQPDDEQEPQAALALPAREVAGKIRSAFIEGFELGLWATPDANEASGFWPHSQAKADADSFAGEPLPVAWRCFHCDEVFTDPKEARLHFGDLYSREAAGFISDPACQISLEQVREMEHQLARYRAEDSDKDRELYAMRAEHTTALMREEEKGYARGLRDISDLNDRAEAAEATISRLTSLLDKAREALRPFAERPDDWTVDDVNRAALTLKELNDGK